MGSIADRSSPTHAPWSPPRSDSDSPYVGENQYTPVTARSGPTENAHGPSSARSGITVPATPNPSDSSTRESHPKHNTSGRHRIVVSTPTPSPTSPRVPA